MFFHLPPSYKVHAFHPGSRAREQPLEKSVCSYSGECSFARKCANGAESERYDDGEVNGAAAENYGASGDGDGGARVPAFNTGFVCVAAREREERVDIELMGRTRTYMSSMSGTV